MSLDIRLTNLKHMGLKIYSSTLDLNDGLVSAVATRLKEIPTDGVCGVVFCGTSEEMEYHSLLDSLKNAVHESLGRQIPITLIPQYLLPQGGLSLDIYVLDGASSARFDVRDGVCYGVIEGEQEKMLFVEGVPASNFAVSVAEQSHEVFTKLDSILSEYGYGVDDIVRQWNYIGNIVACREGKQNYQEFNDARSRYYANGAWSKGYPAATGIGSMDGIVVGCIAFKRDDGVGVYPIDNPLQVAAHIYSKRVLIDDAVDAVKSTPKFERAKLIETERGAICFVSGTAAIRGEESVDASSAKMQTVRTIENIEYLVSKENLERFGSKPYDLKCLYLQVYIKHEEDYADVRKVVEEHYPQVAVVYSLADVCRSELLVEIEGILIS